MGTYVWNPGKFFGRNFPYAFSTFEWDSLSLKLEPDKTGRPASPRNALISVLPELKYQHTSLNPILQKATACTHVCIYACVNSGCGDRVHCMADMWRSEDIFTFPTNWVPGATLRQLALVAKIFIH